MIPSEIIDDIKPRLLEYLQCIRVETRRSGNRFVARCPNHEDRSPSFAVFGQHHESCGCYPCGFTGDVFALSQWLGRSSSFAESVRDVAATIGVHIPDGPEGMPPVRSSPPQKREKPAPPAFVLSEEDQRRIHEARLAFTNAFHSGDSVVDRICDSLGLNRETLRLASFGTSGLGLADGWLCYAYRDGLKRRNPDPAGKMRFRWVVGKATAPWRAEWIKRKTVTVYVTEGESDCLSLIQCGLENDPSVACVAIPGTSGFSESWAKHFVGKRVILCFDVDDAGKQAADRVATILKAHASEVLRWKGPSRHE